MRPSARVGPWFLGRLGLRIQALGFMDSRILVGPWFHGAGMLALSNAKIPPAGQPPPPPLPIHRYPSWEDRIYQVASEGMKDATGDLPVIVDSKNNNGDCSQLRAGYGSDINVPVYATVKGVSEGH